MMREIQGVASDPSLRRRWFHDDYFDLFVWETKTGELTQFELCYGNDSTERALVWRRERGFFHDGAEPASGKPCAGEPIVARFEEAAQSLPRKVRSAVAQRVREYLAGKIRGSSRRKRFRREQWQSAPPASPKTKQ
jgi:hypothetical protein